MFAKSSYINLILCMSTKCSLKVKKNVLATTSKATCLFVDVVGNFHVGVGAILSSDKVVTVNGCRASRLRQARRDELEYSHLSGRILVSWYGRKLDKQRVQKTSREGHQ